MYVHLKKPTDLCLGLVVQTDGADQGEGLPVCYDMKYMDCTVHGIGASKFPLLQQENLTIELLRAA
jgi:hypothetical protein